MPEPTLALIETEDALDRIVEATFSDPEVRLGMGWTDQEDPEEALEAIHGLFNRRFEQDWDLWAVRWEGRLAGLVGLGPIEEPEPSCWYAVYLLERRQGLGRKLTRWALEEARGRGASEVIAITWEENEASRNLLEGEGFELDGPAQYDWSKESSLTWLEYRNELSMVRQREDT